MAIHAEHYRRLAREALETANTVASEEARAGLIEMASVWSRLADKLDGAAPPKTDEIKSMALETIDNPKASYDATIWHSPGYTLVLPWLSQKWLKYCHKLAPTVLKDADLHLPKDQRKLCLDWAADELTRQIIRRQRFH